MSHFVPDLDLPAPRQLPLEVARDTFAIRALTPSVGGTWTNLNAMVILAAEPVLVDTGMGIRRAEWLEDVFSLVAPDAVRWIFVTHLDTDHSGNLLVALEKCPNARVVTSPGESFRMAAALGIPYSRMTMLANGETLDAGDRVLRAVRPPVYDSPYTHGLLDQATGVYYSSDAFCAPMQDVPVDRVDQLPAGFWAKGMAQFHHVSLCPWIALADSGRFRDEVSRLAGLDIQTIVSSHSPVIGRESVATAFAQLAALPEFESGH